MDFLNHSTVLAAGAVLLIQQILKLKIVPVPLANKYPVFTNIVLSVLAAVYANWQNILSPHSWTDWLGVIGTISVVAALAYNMTFRNSAAIKSWEG